MLSHKKGVSSFIIGVVILLLSFGGVLLSTNAIAKTGERALEGASCRTSIGFQKLGDQVFAGLDNNCKTLRASIPEKRSVTRIPENVYKEIATKIANTWWITHEGSIKNLWEEGSWAALIGDEACMVMYELNIRELPQDSTPTFEELFQYLQTDQYKTFDNVPYAYLDYIQTKNGNGVFIMPEAQLDEEGNPLTPGQFNEKEIEGQQVYAISVASKEKTVWNKLLDNKQPPNVVIFSTLDYAEDVGNCLRRGKNVA